MTTMKAIFLALFTLLSTQILTAQDPTDGLRYSYLTGDGGTARNQALGGAGGSLGGEFSTLFINPAGLGFFKTGDFVITPSFLANTNSSQYLGSFAGDNSQKLGLSASGILFSRNYTGKKIRNLTTGIGINKTANFNNHIFYRGTNKTSSYSEQYLEEFQRDKVTDDQTAGQGYPFGSSMAFNTFLINPLFNSSNEVDGYFSLANPAFGLRQTMDQKTSGGITDISVGLGANLQDKLYFGGTLSFPVLRYRRDANYREEDMSGDTHNDFAFFEADETLETTGVGINLKLGAIYKPSQDVQLGVTFLTPTFYQMTDLYNMTISTDGEGFGGQTGVLTQSSAFLNNGNFLRTTYNLVTPLRGMISGTYFFSTGEEVSEQKGFVTGDIEFVNYRGISFKDANNDESYRTYYKQLNSKMDDLYKSAVNLKLGGEIKLNKLMVRLGGAYYGNPYSNESTSLAKITGGLGYRNRGFYIDLAYTYGIHKDIQYPYRLQDVPVQPAKLTNDASNIALTLGFKLY